MAERQTIGRSPWRWAIAAIGSTFVLLELPSLLATPPADTRNDMVDLVLFYALPVVICSFGLGLVWLGLRSGVFLDAQGLLIRHYAAPRSARIAVDDVRAVSVQVAAGSVVGSVTPVLHRVDRHQVGIDALGRYDTRRGRRRAGTDAAKIARLLDIPVLQPGEVAP
jgi:hypothetical protein